MSKRGYISRYLCIIRAIKRGKSCSYEDLKKQIEKQTDLLLSTDDDLVIGFSKRTLQRDLRDIRNLFGIGIYYSKALKGYFMENEDSENMNFQSMIEAFDVFQSLNIAQDVRPFMFAENRKPAGTDNLYGLLHAIKNCLEIEFTYHKFWDIEASQRKTNPYALKEFKNRWYLIAKDHKDKIVKTFALDRLSNLQIKAQKFESDTSYNVEENFRYCYGILGSDVEIPQEIVLSFEPFAGKYIKTLPLHHTQQILIDNKKELRIRLKLKVTYDFMMELLSHGNTMKVIEPQSLVEEIKKTHYNAFQQYCRNNGD